MKKEWDQERGKIYIRMEISLKEIMNEMKRMELDAFDIIMDLFT